MATTIIDLKEKIKLFGRRMFENRELFPALLMIVVGIVSFGLGRLSVKPSPGLSQERTVISAERTEDRSYRSWSSRGGDSNQASVLGSDTVAESEDAVATVSIGTTTGVVNAPETLVTEKKYVGSKNSTKYHLPWCSGAARIAEENKVWFESKEAAAAAGYTPAANCKGL